MDFSRIFSYDNYMIENIDEMSEEEQRAFYGSLYPSSFIGGGTFDKLEAQLIESGYIIEYDSDKNISIFTVENWQNKHRKQLQEEFKKSKLKEELMAKIWHPKNFEKFKYLDSETFGEEL